MRNLFFAKVPNEYFVRLAHSPQHVLHDPFTMGYGA
jgi:hypothetical protein